MALGIEMRGITKSFNGTKVLDDVSIDIRPGEIHGLLGHNGSGKSTLIKILSGAYEMDAGEVAVNDELLTLPLQPNDGPRHGFAFVHQGLGLADDLTVLENLAVTDFHRGFAGKISWRRHVADANEMLARFGIDIDLSAKIGELEPIMQAIIAITRALDTLGNVDGGRLLVLDETTTYLPHDRIETLFSTMKKLTHDGDGILFVSHRLNEILEITDRVSVLRGGELVASANTRDITEGDLIRMIVGRDLDRGDIHIAADGEQVGADVEIQNLTTRNLRGVTFSVKRGEVLGLTGIEGSGFADVPYSLFGAGRNVEGFLDLGGSRIDLSRLDVSEAIKRGMALVPEDRMRLGIARNLSIRENVSLLALQSFLQRGFLSPALEGTFAEKLVNTFDIRFGQLSDPIEQLSGGNQQKCLVAKWLGLSPQLMLLHEPTQGVDIGGRFEIWRHLRAAAESGAGVLIASESAEELTDLCDRVLVFRNGRITGELVGDSVERERIIDLTLAV